MDKEIQKARDITLKRIAQIDNSISVDDLGKFEIGMLELEKKNLISNIKLKSNDRKLNEFCLGRLGTSSVPLEDFEGRYEPQLEEYGETNQKMINTLKLKYYFWLGKFCISNGISIASFCRNAIMKEIRFVQDNKVDIEKIKGGIMITKEASHQNRKKKRRILSQSKQATFLL